MTTTTRQNPGARYHELLALYERLHCEGAKHLELDAESTYPGVSLLPHVEAIKALIDDTGARNILDYGCGKGHQYDPMTVEVGGRKWDSVVDYWDVDEVRCYDPCYPRFRELPKGKFDGVVCTDVLEHCMADDVPWIVDEIFSYALRFVYVSIACYPAKTRLPNGENAHCTVRPPDWWQELFRRSATGRPDLRWKLKLQLPKSASGR